MKKFSLPLVLVLIIATGGCKFKSDTLASYDGGVITRGDLYQWLEDRTIPKDKVVDKKSKQKVRLRQIALERLQLQEAKKAGYDSKPEYNDRLAITEGNFIASFYRQKLRESGEFSEEAIKASIIRLKVETTRIDKNVTVKLSDAEVKKNLKEKTDFASNIIGQLKSGTAFDQLAKQHSDDYSKKDGGDIGYLVAGMREPEFMDAAFKLKKGEVTQEPVVINNSIYIIKATDRTVLTAKNIDKTIGDETKAGRLSRRLKMNSVKDLETRLVAQPDVVNNIEKASLANKTSVLFKIGEVTYTPVELDKVLAIVEGNRKASGFTEKAFDEKQKRLILDKIFKDKLLEREARRLKIDQEQKYLRQWQSIKDSTLISLYRNDVVLAPATVTEDMIRAEYNSMKEKAASRKNGSRIEPYGVMRESLKDRIMRDKRMETTRNWEQGLLDKNHYAVNESKLEGDDETAPKK